MIETVSFTKEEAAQILRRWRQDVPVTEEDSQIIEKLERFVRDSRDGDLHE
jgi:hypothetical protein